MVLDIREQNSTLQTRCVVTNHRTASRASPSIFDRKRTPYLFIFLEKFDEKRDGLIGSEAVSVMYVKID